MLFRSNVLEGKAPKRQYDFKNNAAVKNEPYFPLSSGPTDRLGVSYGVDSYYLAEAGGDYGGRGGGEAGDDARAAFYKTYVEQQQRAWTDLCCSCSNNQANKRL